MHADGKQAREDFLGFVRSFRGSEHPKVKLTAALHVCRATM